MSMSYCARAIVESDQKYQNMYAVLKACDKADVPYPEEVLEYFGGYNNLDNVTESGFSKDIECKKAIEDGYIRKLIVDMRSLPDNTKSIEFLIY